MGFTALVRRRGVGWLRSIRGFLCVLFSYLPELDLGFGNRVAERPIPVEGFEVLAAALAEIRSSVEDSEPEGPPSRLAPIFASGAGDGLQPLLSTLGHGFWARL